jgi:hypothetical protein
LAFSTILDPPFRAIAPRDEFCSWAEIEDPDVFQMVARLMLRPRMNPHGVGARSTGMLSFLG